MSTTDFFRFNAGRSTDLSGRQLFRIHCNRSLGIVRNIYTWSGFGLPSYVLLSLSRLALTVLSGAKN